MPFVNSIFYPTPTINRALVYGALTASVVSLYVLIVAGASLIFHNANNLFASLAATGVIAVIFQPLRERLQRGVSRWLYASATIRPAYSRASPVGWRAPVQATRGWPSWSRRLPPRSSCPTSRSGWMTRLPG